MVEGFEIGDDDDGLLRFRNVQFGGVIDGADVDV